MAPRLKAASPCLLASLASLALLPLPLLANPDADPAPDLGQLQQIGPNDPENPDFSGMVDFSSATPGPDGSWCITKVKYVDHMEQDQVKECWHQNVTQCHDTYITEFLPSQEQKCEESFWKSCKIDFKETPFNYTLKQCHTPLIKECNEYQSEYGAPQKTVCRTWFESECNTTYVQAATGDDLKPNTWCQKMPRKICAPDNCNMVQGPEACRDKMMVSTIQKPEEHCELQPQRHCRLITKLVPHLTTKEVCNTVPKEICMLKLINPHPVKKPIQLKWCTKKKPEIPSYGAPSPDSYGSPRPPPSGYLPAREPAPPPQFSPSQYRPPHSRSGSGTKDDPFVIDADQFQQLQAPPNNIINLSGPGGQREQFRQVRAPTEEHRTSITMHPLLDDKGHEVGQMPIGNNIGQARIDDQALRNEVRFHRPLGHPPHKRHLDISGDMFTGASENKVHVVLPQPGSNNAHRVDKNLKKELFDKAQLIDDVPFAKEIFQPEENSLQSSLTLPPATLLKKSLNPDSNKLLNKSLIPDPTSSPPPPLPTAYIPALSTFAPPPPSSKSVFSPPPKQPTTTARSSRPTSPTSSRRPSPSLGGIRTEVDSGDWQPRRPRGPRQQPRFNGTPKTFIKSSLRNHPGSIF